MSFASHLFILLFLPITVLLYYKLFKSPRSKLFFLLAASLIFYAAAGWQFVFLLLAVSTLTYLSARQGWYLPGVLLNLTALIVFKYLDFGIGSFNQLMNTLHLQFAGQLFKLGLPLGLSFYVFRHIGYLLDVKARRYAATHEIWSFLTFSFYFPQIGAGPITSYPEITTQFQGLPNRLENEQAANGLIYLSYGLIKKVLIEIKSACCLHPASTPPPAFQDSSRPGIS